MPTVHWLGAGLSSGPGIMRLIQNSDNPLVLWNRSLVKAQSIIDQSGGTAQARDLEDWSQLSDAVASGDAVVSMLPANLHSRVADVCMAQNAHFISSSYLTPGMLDRHEPAKTAGICMLNEVGLDPGIDHLLAHALMAEYQSSPVFDKNNEHYFRSYCGGLPKEDNEFHYKFSWSPMGVLRALRTSSQWIADGEARTGDHPWNTISPLTTTLPAGDETFQSFPNRDSLPFMEAYGFGTDWNVREFVRGTLRYNGWAEAWSDIFDLVKAEADANNESKLKAKSEELWDKYQYGEGEADRVVLVVDLEVKRDDETVWHRKYTMDEAGNDRGTAMARLVSLPVSLGVEAVLAGDIPTGVSAAPSDPELVNQWLEKLSAMGETIHKS